MLDRVGLGTTEWLLAVSPPKVGTTARETCTQVVPLYGPLRACFSAALYEDSSRACRACAKL